MVRAADRAETGMSMPFSLPQRLASLPPYLFIDIDRKRRAALAAGRDVINFGVGDPDQPTPGFIIDRLEQAARNPVHHRYPPDGGLPRFRQQAAEFFGRRYGVRLDPQREILGLVGSKEGLGHLPLAVVDPGRTVLIPDPAYPVYRAATLFAGGTPHAMRLSESNGWLPDLDTIPPEVARSATLMFLNYPNNPTGAVASRGFFERAVEFARRNNLILAHDAAYNEVYFAEERPPSVLEIEGAREAAVEFHSLSKTFNMTGWRLGFAAGNPDVLAALAKIKANVDSGAFGAIQEAGIAAYDGIDRPEVAATRELYQQRAETLCAGLRPLGFRVTPPKATFYVWAGVPAGHDGLQVANKLLDEAFVVCIPGIGFGQAGAGYVRFALTVDIDRITTAIERMRKLHW
jgi:LL-diaminopimelate aminotransferase